MIKIVFVPGNGNSTTQDNWFPSVKEELEAYNIEVITTTFPDPELARESYWIPFLRANIKVDDQTILVGHSSGAIAAMRFAEQYPILGSVLVGAYYTDLGIEQEKLSGYFSCSWNWKKIRNNQKWISLFASEDDPWIPIEHARYIHKYLNCEYHEYKNQGHFGGDYVKKEFPELTLSILNYLASVNIIKK
ncbi:MAG: alpha/beta hydrolase [Rickettsia endosymbiont of Eriopis connexa]|nr:alpha/beta hydrolase [Rickettsia endosymbiont of Eriopis connexa]